MLASSTTRPLSVGRTSATAETTVSERRTNRASAKPARRHRPSLSARPRPASGRADTPPAQRAPTPDWRAALTAWPLKLDLRRLGRLFRARERLHRLVFPGERRDRDATGDRGAVRGVATH